MCFLAELTSFAIDVFLDLVVDSAFRRLASNDKRMAKLD